MGKQVGDWALDHYFQPTTRYRPTAENGLMRSGGRVFGPGLCDLDGRGRPGNRRGITLSLSYSSQRWST